MTVYRDGEGITVHHGDALQVLTEMPDASVDAVVTDPPYGLESHGPEQTGANGFRRSRNPADVGRDSVFGRLSRTSPEYIAGPAYQQWCQAWAAECLRLLKPGGHLIAFGSARTGHRLACAVEDAGLEIRPGIAWLYGTGFPRHPGALRPAFEPIVVARRPLVGTVATNTAQYGVGVLNVDACRNGDRWPANVAVDPAVADATGGLFPAFQYEPKAGAGERPVVDGVAHSTVKPLTLMRWLVRLVCPPGGGVLDPFAGSGTTGEACRAEGLRCVLVEQDARCLPLIAARLDRPVQPVLNLGRMVHRADPRPAGEGLI